MVEENKQVKEGEISGIGGWLLFPTIGLFLGLGLWIFIAGLFVFLIFSGEVDAWNIFFLVAAVVNIVFISYLLFLEFKKRKEFPKLAIVFLWFGVLLSIIISIEDGIYTDVIRDAIGAIIWTLYFQRSVRVKNTFVK